MTIGVLKRTDVDALAAYCVGFSQWRAASENIEEEFGLAVEPGGEADKLRTRRLATFERITREANKQMQVWGDRLGLSPAQRTKIRATEAVEIGNGGGSSFFQ